MVIAWFSCGATSAVACKIALQMYDDVEIYYIDTGSAHEDNVRFMTECEKWYGKKIHWRKNPNYFSVQDVLRQTCFINSPYGATCTTKLKKDVRKMIEDEVKEWDGQVWGFDYCQREINRAIRFKQQYPYTKPLFPLIERMISKPDALAMLQRAGIEIPMMYRLGYDNNNCIGCVKGGMGYWNKIRRDFPDRFAEMAEIEREIDATCLKDENGRIFLDELDPKRGDMKQHAVPSCSIICEIEFQSLLDKQTEKVLKGEMSINETV